MEADPTGQSKANGSLPGCTWKLKAKVDFGWNVAAEVSGEKPADTGSTADGGLVEGSHAKTRRREGLGIEFLSYQ
jgi:hypothetical protein